LSRNVGDAAPIYAARVTWHQAGDGISKNIPGTEFASLINILPVPPNRLKLCVI
jgi:hypothetical protein